MIRAAGVASTTANRTATKPKPLDMEKLLEASRGIFRGAKFLQPYRIPEPLRGYGGSSSLRLNDRR
jgi:hypothetical protein